MFNKGMLNLKSKKEVWVYVLIFLFMLMFARANVLGVKLPIITAFAFALIYFNKNVVIVCLVFFVANIINDLTFKGLVIGLNVASVLILLSLICKITNKKPSFIGCLFANVFSLVGYVYYHLTSPMNIIIAFVLMIVSLMFFYVAVQVLNVLFVRSVQSRFTTDESICFAVFLLALFSGLSNIYLYNINVTAMLAVFLLLSSYKILPKYQAISFAMLLGLGISVGEGSVTYIAVYVTMSLIISLLKDYNRFVIAFAVVLVDLIFGIFFNVYIYYSYINVLCNLFACLIFAAIPNKIFNFAKGYSSGYEGSLANEFIAFGQKEMMRNKILKVSELFLNMHNTFRNLSVGSIDKDKVVQFLTENLSFKYCGKCSNSSVCSQNEQIKKAIGCLCEFGLERGKISVLDTSNLLSQHCVKLNGLISEINGAIECFKDYENNMKNQDSNKFIMAEQFAGTSQIMKELADFIIYGDKINYKASKLLIDELTLNNIVVNESVVLENNNGIERIILVVKNSDVLSEKISLCIRSVFRVKFSLETCKMTRFAGWSVLCFASAAKYEISVGFACSSKEPEKISGDTYSFTNLGNNKVLFAICDGMGHGGKANQISSAALNLIENFYKVGFSSEVIFSSVNKILLPVNNDSFTTLDACIFDKNNGVVDFIKIGAVCSVIKSEKESQLVQAESLPLGIIDNIKISSKRCILKDKDIVMLASDGVVDSFSNNEEYLNYVNNENVVNVQMLANNILEESESRDLKHKDDKTIIAFKVCKKE